MNTAVEWNVVATIAAPLIALVIGAALNRAIERRARLVTYLGHVSAHKVNQTSGPPLDVFTHSVVLKNSGRKAAKNVKLAHSILPSFHVIPSVNYEIEQLPDGGANIVIPALIPDEQVTISYLYFPPTTWDKINGPIRSDEGFARVMQVLPTVQAPNWLNQILAGLALLGLTALIYVLFTVVSHYM
ncbi:MAG: hypothetical protein OXQ86_00300 [Gammaproteobacteria bacterium]|nr:hypothetical protein [Gammaproteobacteria bacterium]MDE0415057.1 hypothetical protein [Gammaproteobacteria bacterium]